MQKKTKCNKINFRKLIECIPPKIILDMKWEFSLDMDV